MWSVCDCLHLQWASRSRKDSYKVRTTVFSCLESEKNFITILNSHKYPQIMITIVLPGFFLLAILTVLPLQDILYTNLICMQYLRGVIFAKIWKSVTNLLCLLIILLRLWKKNFIERFAKQNTGCSYITSVPFYDGDYEIFCRFRDFQIFGKIQTLR